MLHLLTIVSITFYQVEGKTKLQDLIPGTVGIPVVEAEERYKPVTDRSKYTAGKNRSIEYFKL